MCWGRRKREKQNTKKGLRLATTSVLQDSLAIKVCMMGDYHIGNFAMRLPNYGATRGPTAGANARPKSRVARGPTAGQRETLHL